MAQLFDEQAVMIWKNKDKSKIGTWEQSREVALGEERGSLCVSGCDRIRRECEYLVGCVCVDG